MLALVMKSSTGIHTKQAHMSTLVAFTRTLALFASFTRMFCVFPVARVEKCVTMRVHRAAALVAFDNYIQCFD